MSAKDVAWEVGGFGSFIAFHSPHVSISERASTPAALLHRAGFLQNIFGEKIFYGRFVTDVLIVGGLEQLLATVAELFANGLLHARILQFALSRSLFAHQTYDAKTE